MSWLLGRAYSCLQAARARRASAREAAPSMPRDARCSIEDRHVAGAAGLRVGRQRDAHRQPWPFVVVATAVGFRFVVDVFSAVGCMPGGVVALAQPRAWASIS